MSKNGAPPAVLEFFENGGESLHLDDEGIVTRNWIAAQISGAGGYMFDNRECINELKSCRFYLQRVTHDSGSKIYIIFTGNNRLRELMSSSRYSLQHTKIIKITGGAGGLSQGWKATKEAAKDSVKIIAVEENRLTVKGGGLALWFAIGMDIAEWHKDYSEPGKDGKRKKDFFDLLPKLGTHLAKAELVAALTSATMALLLGGAALAVGTTVAAPVFLIGVGTILVGATWTYLLEKTDREMGRTLGTEDVTTLIARKTRDIAEGLYKASKDLRYEDYAAAQF